MYSIIIQPVNYVNRKTSRMFSKLNYYSQYLYETCFVNHKNLFSTMSNTIMAIECTIIITIVDLLS